MQEQHNEEEEEKMIQVRYLAWASLKPYSDRNFKPEDLMKLPGDEKRFRNHVNKLKSENKLTTIRKQTPEEQALMKSITKK